MSELKTFIVHLTNGEQIKVKAGYYLPDSSTQGITFYRKDSNAHNHSVAFFPFVNTSRIIEEDSSLLEGGSK